jgi:tryptophan synthase beta chain
MQDEDGQVTEPYSVSAGLDYPGIGPMLAWLSRSGRTRFESATDEEALEAAFLLTRLEGIVPALESAHALAALGKLKFRDDEIVVVTVSGRGDKDMAAYMNYMENNMIKLPGC